MGALEDDLDEGLKVIRQRNLDSHNWGIGMAPQDGWDTCYCCACGKRGAVDCMFQPCPKTKHDVFLHPVNELTMNDYAALAIATAKYPLQGCNMVYPALKLAGEAGELADKIGKHWRNRFNGIVGGDLGQHTLMFVKELANVTEEQAALLAMDHVTLTTDERRAILLELGDVLWYVNALANELGVTLQHVAEMNLNKLRDRKERGTILGEGDNR